ncbi:hypothetical protein TRIP_B120031 [uncultured Desulfatiglans sp.]|nr:hypothetical protein TRIP_B120031 [uncultured Desulfatiglans sp.]
MAIEAWDWRGLDEAGGEEPDLVAGAGRGSSAVWKAEFSRHGGSACALGGRGDADGQIRGAQRRSQGCTDRD